MSLLNSDVRRQLFPADRPVYTKVRDDLPARYVDECECSNSLIANGCVIEGTVINSVLFRGVKVAKGAVVKNSIVMQDAQIQEGAEIDHCILDKQSVIRRNGRLIAPADERVGIDNGGVFNVNAASVHARTVPACVQFNQVNEEEST